MKKVFLIPLMLVFLGMGLLSMNSCSVKNVYPITASYNKAYHDSIDKIVIDTFIAHHPTIGGISITGQTITTASGLRYFKVSDTGAAKQKTVTGFSNVTFSYSIRVPGISTIVDSIPNVNTNTGFTINPLSSTFPGLVEGIEQIHVGGHILLFIPSSLAFQDQTVDLTYVHQDQTQTVYRIQPNTVLIYNLTLTSVASY